MCETSLPKFDSAARLFHNYLFFREKHFITEIQRRW